MKVLLVPNYSRPDAVDDASRLADWLNGRGVELQWAPDMKLHPNEGVDTDGVDLVVSLGGDGTLLRAARIVEYSEIPMLGLSYGHLGFLTCGGPDDLFEIVQAALVGQMHASHRATLDIEVCFSKPDGSELVERRFALNDLALTRGVKGDMIAFDVAVSGHHIDRLRGDGFVVSTATGSTGYALAAGGPIVTPEFDGMICVPVAPHSIRARAFLTSPTDVVEITMSHERRSERLFFSDGQPMGVGLVGERARIRRGPGDIILLDRSVKSFYRSVSRVFYGDSRT
ncbi:ATP-NAD kinase [Olsenella sp. oral taxon 807]|uniref:NAD(+)/NADH kinase n=1 Tax=Olsenella sp. oral taxon 807 TaxID=712411 RepID=UPI00067A1384|nr:NAD(+)/NADH kinase [Olsenella sp. oral taxon 807]AKT49195.1 ATP-NAD kinase [Olsenella sp. oral taxon 807]